LWQIVREAQRRIVPALSRAATEAKIDGSLARGYDTRLFFEEPSEEHDLQQRFPT